MRCPSCDHDNPKNTPRCEACGVALPGAAGAAPVHPGRKLTAFEPIPFAPPPVPYGPSAVPPTEHQPAPPAPPAAAAPPGPGQPFDPSRPWVSPVAASTPALTPPLQAPAASVGRRTVAEVAPVLPPVGGPPPAHSTHNIPTAPSPQAAPPPAYPPAPAAQGAMGVLAALTPGLSGAPAAPPAAAPPGLASPFGVPLPVTSLSSAPAGGPAAPRIVPPGAPAGAAPAGGRPAAVQASGPTQLVQGPEVGGAPQLRGALFEYKGLGSHGLIHTLRSGRNVIGRDPSVCDVIVDDDRVSKQHAFLFIRGDEVSFLDISSNGTVVDGRTVHGTEARLQSPSVIELGGVRLVFVYVPRRLVDGLP